MPVETLEESTPQPYSPNTPEEMTSNGLNNFKMERSIASSGDVDAEIAKLEEDLGVTEEIDPISLKTQEETKTKQLKDEEDYSNKINELATVEDIKTGMGTKSPVNILAGGVLDAAQGVTNAALDIASFFDEKLGIDAMPEDYKVQAISNLIPKSNHPVENAARHMVNFLVPFSAGMKAVRGANKFYNVAKATAVSAATSFAVIDPDEKNLSSLALDHGMRGPILEFLATDMEDSRAERRLKNALEDVVLGVGAELSLNIGSDVIEAVAKGVNFYKKRRQFAKANKQFRELPPDLPESMGPDTVSELSPRSADTPPPVPVEESVELYKPLIDAPLISPPRTLPTGEKLNKAIIAKVARFKDIEGNLPELLANGTGLAGVRALNINLTKINTPESVRKTIKTAATVFHGDMVVAKRGVLKDKEFIKLAEAKVDGAVERIMGRKVGETLSPEDTLLAREMVAVFSDAMDKVTTLRQEGLVDNYTYIAAFDAYQPVVALLSGLSAETGRALRAFGMATGSISGKARYQMVQDVNKLMGKANVEAFASYMHDIPMEEYPKVVKKAFTRTLWDAALEVRTNGLLSKPVTQITNIVSNTGAVVSVGLETGAARGFAIMRGSNAYQGETMAKFQGLISGFNDAMVVAKDSFLSGKTVDEFNKLHMFAEPAITSKNFGVDRDEVSGWSMAGITGLGIDLIGNGIRVPGKSLQAMDDFYKSIHYRMDVQSSAVREANLRGLVDGEYDSFIKEFVSDPPDIISAKAREVARKHTFTAKLEGFPAAVEKVLRKAPGSRLLFPFIRTNINLGLYALERTPIAGALLPEVRMALKKGGAARDMAIARWSLGGMVLAAGAAMYHNNVITGAAPAHAASRKMWRDAGNHPYTIKMGDELYVYNRLEPIGALLGLAVDGSHTLAAMADEDAMTMQGLGAAMALTVGHAFTPEYLIENVGQLIEAMTNEDSQAFNKLIAQMPATFIPMSSFLRGTRRTLDSHMRDTSPNSKGLLGVWEKAINEIKNTIPGLSESLPPMLNIFGEPILYPAGVVANMISPFAGLKKPDKIVLDEFVRLGMTSPILQDPEDGTKAFNVSMPSRVVRLPGGGDSTKKLSAEQNAKYVRLSAGLDAEGNRVGERKTLRDVLMDIIVSDYGVEKNRKRTTELTDEAKKVVLTETIRKFRSKAQRMIFQDTSIVEELEEGQLERARKLTGNPQIGL